MALRLLDYSPWTGETVYHDYDPVTKETKIHTVFSDHQTDAVLEENKAHYNDGTNGWSPTKEWKYVANIPMSVIHEWMVTEGIDVFDNNDREAVRKKLNSHEWLYLRTSPGKI